MERTLVTWQTVGLFSCPRYKNLFQYSFSFVILIYIKKPSVFFVAKVGISLKTIVINKYGITPTYSHSKKTAHSISFPKFSVSGNTKTSSSSSSILKYLNTTRRTTKHDILQHVIIYLTDTKPKYRSNVWKTMLHNLGPCRTTFSSNSIQ